MAGAFDRITRLDALAVTSRRVLVRADLDVPLDARGAVSDDQKLRACLPTLRHLLDKGARVVLASHLGRAGRAEGARYSLAAVGEGLAELLAMDIVLADECVGDGARRVVRDLRDGRLAMLENLHFHRGEASNDEGFAAELAGLCDAYVSEAFGCAHVATASVARVPALVGARAAGVGFARELDALGSVTPSPARPFALVVGGASLADKAPLLEALLPRANAVLLGGAVANTFLAAMGRDLGRTVVEPERFALARALVERARERKVALHVPVDVVVAPAPNAPEGRVVRVDAVSAGDVVVDVGPATVAAFRERLLGAKTVLWSGPVGVMEQSPFAEGTAGVARAVAEAATRSVVVGDATALAVRALGLEGRFAHVSSSSAAAFELLRGAKLPGVEALLS